MLIRKTLKYRIYPTKSQEQFFLNSFGCCRFLYNYYLDKNKKLYEENKDIKDSKKYSSYVDNAKDLTSLKKILPWLEVPDSQALQVSLKTLDESFKDFFKKEGGFPKFKSKKDDRSFKSIGLLKYDEVTKELKIPKLKETIKLNHPKKDKNKLKQEYIKTVSIVKEPSGKWYACLSVEINQEHLPKVDATIGLDLGIKDLIVDSNGKAIGNPKFLKYFEKKIAYKQKQLAKKKKGSKNRAKARRALAITYEKLKNVRLDFLHKITKQIINENQVIICEDLKVADMIQNGKTKSLRKSLQNVCFGEILRQLKYKSAWYGRTFHQVDQYYPSSKTCSECGYVLEELGLDIRSWECLECHAKHDRDKNAAINIRKRGIKDLRAISLGPRNVVPTQKPEEALALAKSKIQEAAAFMQQ